MGKKWYLLIVIIILLILSIPIGIYSGVFFTDNDRKTVDEKIIKYFDNKTGNIGFGSAPQSYDKYILPLSPKGWNITINSLYKISITQEVSRRTYEKTGVTKKSNISGYEQVEYKLVNEVVEKWYFELEKNNDTWEIIEARMI